MHHAYYIAGISIYIAKQIGHLELVQINIHEYIHNLRRNILE